MRLGQIEILDIIFCDEVRKEITGKDIIIGVYPGEIIVQQFPCRIDLMFWIHFKASHHGTMDYDFKVVFDNGEDIADGRVNLSVHRTDILGSMTLPKIMVPLNKEGLIGFLMRESGNEDFMLIGECAVKLGEVPR